MTGTIEKLGALAAGSRFRRIYEKLQTGGDQVYKDAGFDFKSSWFPVYYVLAKSGNPQTVTDITDQIAFSHITVKNIVRELEKDRLIVIEANPDDKRSKLISLSLGGKQLLRKLEPLWLSFAHALENLLAAGHPDMINILSRIDTALQESSLNDRVQALRQNNISILDYRPELKPHFSRLARPWLLDVLDGKLEKEDEFSLENPEKAYIQQGGFLFFAEYQGRIVGCTGLKRLDGQLFELVKLFVHPEYRQLGIATRLLERCISRAKENQASAIWLQSIMSMPKAHKLYYKHGFTDKEAPPQMHVLDRTEKIMCLSL